MTLLPVPGTGTLGQLALGDPSTTMAAWWDRALLDWTRFGLGNHIWTGSVTWDPEGLFSTLPAIATTMLGTVAGRWIASDTPIADRLAALFAAGALGMMAGLVWNWSFPINKGIWTSSYVVFTAGVACVTLATVTWMIDVQRVTWWTKPLVVYGSNPLVAFVGSGVMARIIYSIWFVQRGGGSVPMVTAIYDSVFASWLAPRNASLAFAITFVLFWYAVLYALYRRRIFVKV
jgi:predicted acyltransferase